ncbi:MAG: AraC family transcriptional regulator, partial [Clostridia bacterium]
YQIEMEFWFASHKVDVLALDKLVCQYTHNGVSRVAAEPVLLNGDALEDTDMAAIAAQVQKMSMLHFKFSMTVGISVSFHVLACLHDAYAEALRATEQRYLTGVGCVQFAGDIVVDTQEESISVLEERLIAQFKKEAFFGCAETLAQYVGEISHCGNPERARQAMSLLMLSLRQAARHVSLPGGAQEDARWEALSACEFETIQQAQEALLACLMRLADARVALETSRDSHLINDVMNYMEGNLGDPSINLDVIAAHLGVSSGYLSRTFKEQTQHTPMQYLDSLRMRQARTLLKNTKLHMTEILSACGYVDKTNFIRKFRKLYGVTPMAWRGSEQSNTEEELQELEETIETEEIDREE